MTNKAEIRKIAELVNGRTAGSGTPPETVSGTCSVDNYISGKVTFVRNSRYVHYLSGLTGAVVVMAETLAGYADDYPGNTYIIVADAVRAMMLLQEYFYADETGLPGKGIASSAVIDKTAGVGERVSVGAQTVIGRNVVIGSGTVIYPNVTVYDNCRIGDDCVIYSGAVIGSAGFRIEQYPDEKTIERMPHAGGVVLGDRVEIGANTTIDRATFENNATSIGDDTKIDNQVQIGHNAAIGKRNVICAQSCIGGSVRSGDDVWTGIGVTVSSGVTIGHRAKLLLNAVVAYDIADNEVVSGFYAMPHATWKDLWKKWTMQS